MTAHAEKEHYVFGRTEILYLDYHPITCVTDLQLWMLQGQNWLRLHFVEKESTWTLCCVHAYDVMVSPGYTRIMHEEEKPLPHYTKRNSILEFHKQYMYMWTSRRCELLSAYIYEKFEAYR